MNTYTNIPFLMSRRLMSCHSYCLSGYHPPHRRYPRRVQRQSPARAPPRLVRRARQQELHGPAAVRLEEEELVWLSGRAKPPLLPTFGSPRAEVGRLVARSGDGGSFALRRGDEAAGAAA